MNGVIPQIPCQGLNYVSKDNLTLNVPQNDIYISSSIIFNIFIFFRGNKSSQPRGWYFEVSIQIVAQS